MNIGYKILLATTFLATFGDNLIGSFYAVFVQKIGGSILDIGYSVTLYCITTGILIILVGKMSDRVNKKHITTLGFLLGAIGNFGYIFISHPYQLFMLQIVFAISTACLAAPLSALFATFIQKEKEGLQWALEGGGSKIIIGLSVLAGTFIVNYLGFTVLFLTMGALQLVATGLQMRLKLPDKILA